MTKAEKMREITARALKEKENNKVRQNRMFAEKMVNTKFRKYADKGKTGCSFTVPKKYSAPLIIETLASMGFNTTKSGYKNGKVHIIAQW